MSFSDDPHVGDIDFILCCLCQKESESKVLCPSKNGKLSTYDLLAKDLTNFKNLGVNPIPVRIERLGCNIAETLKVNRAWFHKSCRSLCDNHKFNRIKKRKEKEESNVSPKKKTRSSADTSFQRDKPECIMTSCSETGEVLLGSTLHKAMTLKVLFHAFLICCIIIWSGLIFGGSSIKGNVRYVRDNSVILDRFLFYHQMRNYNSLLIIPIYFCYQSK